jgi:hypothetical protein
LLYSSEKDSKAQEQNPIYRTMRFKDFMLKENNAYGNIVSMFGGTTPGAGGMASARTVGGGNVSGGTDANADPALELTGATPEDKANLAIQTMAQGLTLTGKDASSAYTGLTQDDIRAAMKMGASKTPNSSDKNGLLAFGDKVNAVDAEKVLQDMGMAAKPNQQQQAQVQQQQTPQVAQTPMALAAMRSM